MELARQALLFREVSNYEPVEADSLAKSFTVKEDPLLCKTIKTTQALGGLSFNVKD